jgi:pyridoxamine 5'-phosphate oxidase
MSNIADLRQSYTKGGFVEADALPDAFDQFQQWFDQAIAAECYEPNAMTLATATEDGKPSARIVLLKGFDTSGFVFYTNYNSQKSQELEANPQVALLFFWDDLERQVRIDGVAQKTDSQESDEYFQSRPLGSRIGAWVSEQSTVIKSREVLEMHQADFEQRFEEGNVPRPPHWGGWRIVPQSIEFWQGRPNRLHDRLRYTRTDGGAWHIERISP